MTVISEFVIYCIVRHGNTNSIQNPSTVTYPTMELYCILLPLMLLCRTTWQITNSLLLQIWPTVDRVDIKGNMKQCFQTKLYKLPSDKYRHGLSCEPSCPSFWPVTSIFDEHKMTILYNFSPFWTISDHFGPLYTILNRYFIKNDGWLRDPS